MRPSSIVFLKLKKQKAVNTQMSIPQRNLAGERKEMANKAVGSFGSALLSTWLLISSVPSFRL